MSTFAVVVTGAAGSIGRALCEEFRKASYFVLATDIQMDSPHQLADAYLPCDLIRLSDDAVYASDFFRTAFQILDKQDSPLKVIVNNAAVQLLGGLRSITRDTWERTLAVNVTAPLLLTQGFLERLEAAEGLVINIGSIHARLTKPNFVAYATSKSALSGLTRALSVDLGNRVRVLGIEPAAIDTVMLSEGFGGDAWKKEALAAHHPLNRIGSAGEVARLAVALARPGTEYLQGSIVTIDGGISNRLHDPS